MSVDIASANRFVEQGLGLQRANDPAAKGFSGARVPCAEIDDLEAVGGLGVGQGDEAIAAPHFVLGPFLGILDLGLNVATVGAVEIGAKHAFGDLARDPPPGKPQFDPLPKLPARLLRAPDERARIEPRRRSSLLGPLGDAVDHLAGRRPLRLRIDDDEGQARRILDGRTVLGKRDDRNRGATGELALDELANGGPNLGLFVE